MLKVEVRKMFRSNGLIDDVVIHGEPDDYLKFSKTIQSVIESKKLTTHETNSSIGIEIIFDESVDQELFTSLQNQENEYFSIKDWDERDTLRVVGSEVILNTLYNFIVGLSGSGQGYSYISEYSEKYKYSFDSPEWQLHVDVV